MTKPQNPTAQDWRDERDAEPDQFPEPDYSDPVNTLD